jgi:putative N6-adenine-specific DNA methylase
MDYKIIATCAFGLENVTARELKDLGYEDLKLENGRVMFEGDEMDIAICNIHLRTAERVLICLSEFEAFSFEELYQGTLAVDFPSIVPLDGKMHVTGKSVKSTLHSVPDCQSIVKKAVVDSMRKTYRNELFPEDGPIYKIEVGILKDRVTLTLDTSGPGLHKRGYRESSGTAPLKETLAAALVLIAGYDGERPLVDPFCGSGTILIEAAMIAQNIAPGISRSFVSETWPTFPSDIWEQVREGAKLAEKRRKLSITGYDNDSYVLSTARINAKKAGVFDNIYFYKEDFRNLTLNDRDIILITNPPYGERMGEAAEVASLMTKLGRDKARMQDADYFVLSSMDGFEKAFGRKASKNRKLYNGRIMTYYYQYFAEKKVT